MPIKGKCVPGQKYKIDCNTCFCKNDGNLMCTKVLCLPDKRLRDGRRQNNESIAMALKNNTEYKNAKKEAKPKKKNNKLIELPTLPETCVPGKIYKKGCQRCICQDNKKGVCTKKKNACKVHKKAFRIRYLKDLRPPFKPGEVERLPELQHRQVKCEPGMSYRVDCNGCVCLANHNLICDEFICLSYDDMHRIDAVEKSRGYCDSQTYNKTVKNCVECVCVKNRVKCNEVAGCISEYDKQLLNWNNGKPKLTLDMFKETCMPGGVYRMDCNNCYCQDDKTLRCTQKTCLNYSQSKALEDQRMYLIQYGL